MKLKLNALLLLFSVLLLIGCSKTRKDSIPQPGYSMMDNYIIYLASDNEISKVEYYISDTLNYIIAFSYNPSQVVKITTNYKNVQMDKITYYLNSAGIADSTVDSSYHNSIATNVSVHKFTYDSDGYLISDKTMENNNESFTATYERTNGNVEHIQIDVADCAPYNYSYNTISNKLDIVNFYGNYLGKKNSNLISEEYASCVNSDHGTTNYNYTLDSDGWVTKRISNYISDHPGSSTSIKTLSTFQYKF